jgi:hypothetical protein
MTATITKLIDRKYPDKYIRDGFNIFAKSNVSSIVDDWFHENKVWDIDFKCKTWTKLKTAANKLNIAAIRSVVDCDCDITFSVYAGCSSCPCSPGFRVRKCVGGNVRLNSDVWMDIEVDASTVVAMLPKYTEMLQKEIELHNELELLKETAGV